MKASRDLNFYLELPYEIIVRKEEEDNGYTAYCEELGLSACHGRGESEVSAIKSFYEEKDIYLEYLFNSNKQIPLPRKMSETFLLEEFKKFLTLQLRQDHSDR